MYAEISINEKMLKYQDKVIKAEILSLANFEI